MRCEIRGDNDQTLTLSLKKQWEEIDRQSSIAQKKFHESALKLEQDFEKDLLTFAIEHKTWRVYSVQYDDEKLSETSKQ